MERMKGLVSRCSVLLMVVLILLPGMSAVPPDTWRKGQEAELTGHTFDEDHWTADSIEFERDNGTARFAMSYVREGDAQAFLIAFRDYRRDGNVSTLPYQLFGLHYYTPKGHEVFIGAVLAFLMAYNDTFNGTGEGRNGMPDPGNERTFFVIPFGAGEALGNGSNETYAPEVDVLPVVRDGHTYEFGMRYRNLYAIVTENFIASLILRTGYIMKFSEFTVRYRVTFGNGTVRAETFYEIGQVTELWAFILGIPVPLDPADIPENMGISVVHYVAVFASTYNVRHVDGRELEEATTPTDDLEVKVGNDDDRAFRIGYRGTYDLVNESSGAPVATDLSAINMLVAPRQADRDLINWQAGFSLDLFSTVCYAMTERYQRTFRSPSAFQMWAALTFKAGAFWYAVAFPNWSGQRVVHDPVYTAYVGARPSEGGDEAPGFEAVGVLLAAAVVVPALGRRRRRG
ncbi:MAG TPA: hypothetical protein EYP43_02980 [Thermoplasmata archaeon]|nr:hypothetical protein [Thermoplasmata archaeon]